MSTRRGPAAAPRCWHRLLIPLSIMLAVATAAATPQRSKELAPSNGVRETQPGGLRGEAALSRVYDLILNGSFADVPAELRRACGPAPPEACQLLDATALWWQIQLDPDSRALDDEFSAAVDRAIRAAEGWTSRSPDNAEAWFYLGGAYAARVQWLVLRDEKLAAARDGRRIKEVLERSVALDPNLDDAYFGIGLYRYYADVAPTAARILRFLLLLPGGDRKEGLAQMQRARAQGRLLRGEADYQLHILYLWYERQTARALELLRELRQQYPGNPLFVARIAEIEDAYEHDIIASLTTWRELLALARAERVHSAELAEVRARLAIARHLDSLAETDESIEHLEHVVALKPEAPYSSLALAHLRLGEAHDRLNSRAEAVAAYREASLAAPEGDRHNIRREAAERLRKTPNARHAEAFRLSLEGWRKLDEKDVPAAASALERAISLNPRDPVARYRYGRILGERGEYAAALRQFEHAIREARLCPAPILGAVYLEAGQLYERAGQQTQASSAYRLASTLFGAADETHRLAARALARLQK
jgi:tetratricopeptide (TPR) repeat protein